MHEYIIWFSKRGSVDWLWHNLKASRDTVGTHLLVEPQRIYIIIRSVVRKRVDGSFIRHLDVVIPTRLHVFFSYVPYIVKTLHRSRIIHAEWQIETSSKQVVWFNNFKSPRSLLHYGDHLPIFHIISHNTRLRVWTRRKLGIVVSISGTLSPRLDARANVWPAKRTCAE